MLCCTHVEKFNCGLIAEKAALLAQSLLQRRDMTGGRIQSASQLVVPSVQRVNIVDGALDKAGLSNVCAGVPGRSSS